MMGSNSDARGWGLAEQHLMPEAVVAFVDGELTPTAQDRASSHAARCPFCAGEIAAQRQARAAVRTAAAPAMPAGLLASLQAIPHNVELPGIPDGLVVDSDGQLMAVQRPVRVTGLPFGASPPLGSSTRLGNGKAVLGRTGVMVSGLVLGALAIVATGTGPDGTNPDEQARDEQRSTMTGVPPVQPAGLVAKLGGDTDLRTDLDLLTGR